MTRSEDATVTALGLMSGTSLDGIDLALLTTNGAAVIDFSRDGFVAYTPETRALLRGVLDQAADWPKAQLKNPDDWPAPLQQAAAAVTQAHIAAVQGFLDADNAPALIGFHGQTVCHRPISRSGDEGFTLQIGDGLALAAATGIDVVGQFRLNDMRHGGQGAPLAPLFHAALAGDERPLAVLNLGGVGNMTWLGAGNAMMAFDTGPANALIDDWVATHSGQAYDADGALAATGQVDAAVLAALMAHPYFDAPPPKSLDRLAFATDIVRPLNAADGAATLTAFTAASVARALTFCPQPPQRLILCGGGRHNKTLAAMLSAQCGVEIIDCDALGWRGDSLEAQAFAWLAVRSQNDLPLSRPETTGVAAPVSGGVMYSAR